VFHNFIGNSKKEVTECCYNELFLDSLTIFSVSNCTIYCIFIHSLPETRMKIGIISDIHEDPVNLKKALHALSNQCDEVACLGDIVGFTPDFYSYTPDANECIRLVKENCRFVVVGNHDMFAVKRIPEHCGNFHFHENWYSMSTEAKRKLAGRKIWLYENERSASLNDTSHEYLMNLPELHILNSDTGDTLFSHFMFPDISGSGTLKPSTYKAVEAHRSFMDKHSCKTAFCGHTHPEGLLISSPVKSKMRLLKLPVDVLRFEKKVNTPDRCFFSVPAIANGSRRSGYAVFDTTAREVFTCSL